MGCEQMDTDQKYPEPRCSMARIRSRGSGSEQGEATPDSTAPDIDITQSVRFFGQELSRMA
jgi:hypothetical protein